MNIHVGNLPFSLTDEELRQLFAAHGEVASAKVIIDRESGRSKGYGFVEMKDAAQAQAAIAALNGAAVKERPLRVSESQKDRPAPRRP